MKIYHRFTFIALFFLFCVFANNKCIAQSDTSLINLQTSDSITSSIEQQNSDTSIIIPKTKKSPLESQVIYSSNDSILFDIVEQRVFLYGGASIKYENITIVADYIEISFADNMLLAAGRLDSAGQLQGKPVFTENLSSFRSDTMLYNFDTKKGIIKKVITEEGEGYLHGTRVKKLANDELFISTGKYTTCDLEHPHFYIGFTKAKVIPENKIVTGPVFLYVADVPLPVVLPFGFFPNKKGQQSGILIPTYGESANRGFFLENGGYYFGINEYVDLALRGDIYSRGSWAIKTISNYNKRYKFNGSIDLNYALNIQSEKGFPDYARGSDFFVRWNHSQDAKARPNSRFSANVNAGSSNFHKYNPSTTGDYLSNTFQSNISYQATIASKYNFSVNIRHSQNTLNNRVDLSLPELVFSANRFYPLRRKVQVGQLKWYENINVGYTMNAKNELSTLDSLFFTEQSLQNFRNGIKHNIPINSSVKVLKFFSWNNSVNYNERWYTESIRKGWSNDIDPNNLIQGYVKTDTLDGFATSRDFSFSTALNTKLYGMFKFRKGPIQAVRHLLTPSLSFTYIPDFGAYTWGYYKFYGSKNSVQPVKYSIFENGIFGSPPANKSGNINLTLANNLEMKIRTPKDSVSDTKKVVLIENFTISSSYDVARDSMNFSKILLSGRTVLFKNFDIRYMAALDPYIVDSNGRNVNQFEWDVNKRIARLNNSEWALSLNWNLSSKKTNNNTSAVSPATRGTEEEVALVEAHPEAYVDFNVPWNLTLSYTFRHTTTFSYIFFEPERENEIVQTLNFYGDVNITPKWKIGFRSGYDFDTKSLSYTSVDIYRDLHCWELKFNWIPTGYRKSWNVTINVKAAVLQDLKLTKKKDWRDVYY
ncbi:MAG: putative LPS assembly protein LptD [Bacteroidales bacterium]|nr:putative LPS assembly protein LptD [Bacteroidales bacterium]